MIPEIDKLLLNWAMWKKGVGVQVGAPKRATSWWGPMVLDPNMGSEESTHHTTVDQIAARHLDQLIAKLETRLRRTLSEHYLLGGAKSQKAKAVGCSERTFYNWLDEAHVAVSDALRIKMSKPHCVVAPDSEKLPIVA
jgi:hypothetical protein